MYVSRGTAAEEGGGVAAMEVVELRFSVRVAIQRALSQIAAPTNTNAVSSKSIPRRKPDAGGRGSGSSNNGGGGPGGISLVALTWGGRAKAGGLSLPAVAPHPGRICDRTAVALCVNVTPDLPEGPGD